MFGLLKTLGIFSGLIGEVWNAVTSWNLEKRGEQAKTSADTSADLVVAQAERKDDVNGPRTKADVISLMDGGKI